MRESGNGQKTYKKSLGAICRDVYMRTWLASRVTEALNTQLSG